MPHLGNLRFEIHDPDILRLDRIPNFYDRVVAAFDLVASKTDAAQSEERQEGVQVDRKRDGLIGLCIVVHRLLLVLMPISSVFLGFFAHIVGGGVGY